MTKNSRASVIGYMKPPELFFATYYPAYYVVY